ncbi:PocR ligand-binding domain-containing protein [Halanaerobacter jeridensis]|uniref:Ligand-binding sensor protein/archaellum component FlaC n=1 Tax=Halanaerobacter jeridensis TaxID=706427 RepID=A0A938XTB6_9FIRM|nr:PocR ligand-binding domain-containing protein [Halanaerobacter jeridensis]MBM7557155.1 ligand-binding sensor protein/archaellum component FlaC [Halanaerobacter jeridensis]
MKSSEKEALQIDELLDLDFIQEFQDEFAKSLGISSVTVDLEGNPITSPSGFTEFCDYIRSSEEGLKRCKKCDREGGRKAKESGEPVVYECHSGLCDFAVPIVIEGDQIGSILGGQILPEDPNEAEFREIAQELNLDPNKLIDMLDDVYTLDRARIESAANMLYLVANTISEVWYQQSELQKMASALSENLSEIASAMDDISATAMEINEKQTLLNDKIENVNSLATEIEQFVNFIEKIADKTNMLGLNASIESARAGKHGRGFDVVAEEIRNLSQDSKKRVEQIKELVPRIQESTTETSQIANETLENIEEQSATLQEVTASTEELNSLSEELLNLANSN